MKGLTILWIIWIHTANPGFGNYRNPIFFFASGIFFKLSDAKSFFTKRILLIIVPLVFFYIASVPFRYIVDVWDYRDMHAFDWSRLLEIFYVVDHSDYISLNVPLWFLLTLFFIQCYSFFIFRLPKWVVLILAILSLVFFEEFPKIPTVFMINFAMAWFSYFALGYLMGKPIIKFLNSLPRKVFVFVITLLIVVGCILFEQLEIADWHNMVEKTKLVMFIVCFMTFFSFFNGWRSLEVLRFFGKNSLIVLGAHLWILVPVARVMMRLTREVNPWYGLLSAVITAIILIPVIKWMNRYIPFLVGKQKA